jgi:hypothetical protein
MKALWNSLSVVFQRLLGYFGKDRKSNQGPTLLGMETDVHRRTPNADDIRKAVKEAKEELIKAKEF